MMKRVITITSEKDSNTDDHLWNSDLVKNQENSFAYSDDADIIRAMNIVKDTGFKITFIEFHNISLQDLPEKKDE